MIILGVDPGTATTGFGIIETSEHDLKLVDYGCISTKANLKLEDRLNQIYEDLENLIIEFKPELAGIEEIFFTKNIKTAISVSHARGVIMQTITKHHIPILTFTPTQIKSAITGYGKADKHQVQTMSKMILNLDKIPKPDDAADALAIAICCANNLNRYE
ncbi:MAG: crossover junction endodeoxyribonuclease RuvC, crossover junction endodeoxyribonuclease RuvC [Candidatus Peregrinibacteria bacterium GW2011_GWF2_33_10]|nr:MAG: crossover junction endodeoxyribonuclease RuvC, crossover junction endodeoxyribonuclease RuvC [Candidatus Peregrinibacteria bacterium GW2011_GWF2_33_10]OGJ45318.1 MAG: crossover junction endodeoxyribonuclease RuvC [Candidatus Peregrinibacteria bacterium RIFOXYA12_FULL_33_12]OGJ45390.1 MAG: crossover junction endodeoxyribonuclease RuvC [Candidatus Peregrinibacteria bacterium RIFOXYA2_FULL_33_21]OGJ50993.1 MAG: crossover junction endodeoxyribonuclease RuvC [Candidatus Peregrinibacteria bact